MDAQARFSTRRPRQISGHNNLYGITATEFTHIFHFFPLVAEPGKVAALNAFRNLEKGPVK